MANPSMMELQQKLSQLGWKIEFEAWDKVAEGMDPNATPLRQLATAALRITGDGEDPADQGGIHGRQGALKDQGVCVSQNIETFKASLRPRRSH